MASHTVYAVASGKGGVGKTATTVNLGASLAEAGHDVAIVDADLGMANLGGFIGVEPDQTLHEVLAGDASLEEATYEALNGLAVVPSGISLNGFANVETAALSDAVGALRDAFDYVLLDLGAGLSHDTVLPLALADAVILVSTPQPVSVQDTAKTRQITDRLGGQVAGVVLTRAGSPADLELNEIRDTLELPALAVIPEDDAVPASARDGKAVLQSDPDSPTVEGYRGLAHIVEEESLETAPVVPEMPEPDPSTAEPARTTSGDAAGEPARPDEGESARSDESESAQPDEGEPAEPERTPGTGAGTDGESEPEPAAEDGTSDGTEPDTASAEPTADTGETDDAETTAAEIAAAIEDAAGDTGSVGSEGGSTGESAEPESPSESDPSTQSESTRESEPASESEPATDSAEAAEAAADDGEVEPEAFKVESTEEPDSEEGEAVDQLFSVEGANPDDGDEEDESGGLFGRFLG